MISLQTYKQGAEDELAEVNLKLSRLEWVLGHVRQNVLGLRESVHAEMKRQGITIVPSLNEMRTKYRRLGPLISAQKEAEEKLKWLEIRRINLLKRRKQLLGDE